ncbi:aldose epimerase family protein [Szabonella alba]|uniref:Galactose mutarotase n=1 Tax=Szabonella alba TaxID=2804194 RepID=A0A8K0Y0S8_9RHOB|nr:aldose epimerase family protein [Szabonella alba]MBL4918136.1 galactose mutarotase [Szabonella alba]
MIRDFGKAPDNALVHGVTLSAGNLQAEILTWGAALRSVRLAGVAHDLTHGVQRMADFFPDMRFHGAIVGPVANRISGARAVIDGREHRFEIDSEPGATLHSGPSGLHRRLWQIADHRPDRLVLHCALADGEGGFPGNRVIRATYGLQAPATLRLTITMQTDAPTVANPAHHGYWTLDGPGGIAGQRLCINADHVTEVDAALLPTGRLLPVAESGFDFRAPRLIEPGQPPLDTNFCLSRARGKLRDVLWLEGRSGVSLTLATTEPGLQIYDQRPGYQALAIEPQFWPDAPNRPEFPPIMLQPGQDWQQVSEWRFARPGETPSTLSP